MKAAEISEWDATLRATRKIQDKLQRPLDRGIITAVAGLRHLGFDTTSSCFGHFDRITGGPYIVIQPLEAVQFTHSIPKGKENTPAARKIRKKANKIRASELRRLLLVLNDFYKSNPEAIGALIVQSLPQTYISISAQTADTAYGEKKVQQRRILESNRRLFVALGSYLEALALDAADRQSTESIHPLRTQHR
ncbi:MAG: hypothetical protein WA972_12735 [Rhodococcus qingshengii]